MSNTESFNNVTVVKKANIFFEGKCVSHVIIEADGSRKTIGVILPSSLTFNTAASEIMETVSGSCRVRLKGEQTWKTYNKGESFSIPADWSFDIEVEGEPYNYVCYFGK